MALGVHVEEHRAVSVIDWLYANALIVVVFVIFVFIDSAQAERTKATANSLFKRVVIRLICCAVFFVGAEQGITSVCQLVIFVAIFADVINSDAVVAILVDDPHDRQVDLVDLKAWLVVKLLCKVAFPLRTSDGIKATILKALQALFTHGTLYAVKLQKRFFVDVCQTLFLGHSCHSIASQ